MPKYFCPKWFGATGYISEVRMVISGNSDVKDLAAVGVQNKFDKIIFSSATLCSFRTATAFETVFPVPENK